MNNLRSPISKDFFDIKAIFKGIWEEIAKRNYNCIFQTFKNEINFAKKAFPTPIPIFCAHSTVKLILKLARFLEIFMMFLDLLHIAVDHLVVFLDEM